MKIIDILKKSKSVVVNDGFKHKNIKYTNVHLVEIPHWRHNCGETVIVVYGDNGNYKSCLITDLYCVNTDKEYNSKNGIWLGERKYLFLA